MLSTTHFLVNNRYSLINTTGVYFTCYNAYLLMSLCVQKSVYFFTLCFCYWLRKRYPIGNNYFSASAPKFNRKLTSILGNSRALLRGKKNHESLTIKTNTPCINNNLYTTQKIIKHNLFLYDYTGLSEFRKKYFQK